MTTSNVGNGESSRVPVSTISERVLHFESDVYRANDALRRAMDGWSSSRPEHANLDYVELQLLYALNAVAAARVELAELAALAHGDPAEVLPDPDPDTRYCLPEVEPDTDRRKGGDA